MNPFDRGKSVSQRKGAEYRRDRKVPIQSRINVQDLSAIAQYMHSLGINSRTRSELVSNAISAFAAILTRNNKAARPDTAEKAVANLEALGIGWTHGTREHRLVTRMLEEESMELESSPRVSPNQIEEAMRIWERIERERLEKKDETAGEIAAKVPDRSAIRGS